jgi:hypothetical protein
VSKLNIAEVVQQIAHLQFGTFSHFHLHQALAVLIFAL